METQMLVDVWGLMKSYVPAKDRSVVAEKFVDIAMDNGIDDESLRELIGHDDADNLKLALNTMPSSDEFKAVYIDLEFIKLSMLSNSRILLIFLLLGTFVSLVLIFLVQAYKSKH